MNKALTRLSLIAIALSVTSIAFSEPKFSPVSEATYDWGEVTQGEKISHSFTFQNTGEDTLIILNVRSSCGCTAALASKDHLAPGETGEITATFDSAGRSKKQRKSINVATNDPATTTFTFVLEGHIKVPFEIKPSYLTFQNVTKGSSSTSEVTITNHLESTIKLGIPESPNKELQIKIAKAALKPGETTTITGVFTPVETRGRLTGTVVIPFEGEESKTVKIRVWGRVNES